MTDSRQDAPGSPGPSNSESPRLRLGVLLSGSGTTLQNLIDRSTDGRLAADVVCVISNRESAFGLQRAERHHIPAYVEATDGAIYARLREHRVDYVCLAGYLKLLTIADDFTDRILNVHPSLLPAFGGRGCYGDRVHRAVLEAGVAESGCTVHFVDEQYDHGRVLLQRRVPVLPDDTVETLRERVMAAEREPYPEVLEQLRRELPDFPGRTRAPDPS